MSLPQPAASYHENHEQRIRELENRTGGIMQAVMANGRAIAALDAKLGTLDVKLATHGALLRAIAVKLDVSVEGVKS